MAGNERLVLDDRHELFLQSVVVPFQRAQVQFWRYYRSLPEQQKEDPLLDFVKGELTHMKYDAAKDAIVYEAVDYDDEWLPLDKPYESIKREPEEIAPDELEAFNQFLSELPLRDPVE